MTTSANSSSSRLFHLLTRCKWDEATGFINMNPSVASTLLDSGKRASQVSPIHLVLAHVTCKGDVPLKVVDLLLKLAPEFAAHQQPYTGNAPLHAVFYNAFLTAKKRTMIAQRLLKVSPASAKIKNRDGRTALHTNCSQHCNYEPILTLLEASPETASWPDNNGDLALHLACRSQKSPNKSIQALFDAFPAGIKTKNDNGETPLDMVRKHALDDRKWKARLTLLRKLEREFNNLIKTDDNVDEGVVTSHRSSTSTASTDDTDYCTITRVVSDEAPESPARDLISKRLSTVLVAPRAPLKRKTKSQFLQKYTTTHEEKSEIESVCVNVLASLKRRKFNIEDI